MQEGSAAEYISIDEAIDILEVTEETAAIYGRYRIIAPVDSSGDKPLYSKEEVLIAKAMLRLGKRSDKTLKEIAATVQGLVRMKDTGRDSERGTSKKKVLIIDDERPVCDLIKVCIERVFREKEPTIAVAFDGQTGISMAKRMKPDLILLDLGLGETSGFDVLEELSHHPSTLHTKFVLMSGYLDISVSPEGEDLEEEQKERLNLGNWPFLRKPLNSGVLIREVAALLDPAEE